MLFNTIDFVIFFVFVLTVMITVKKRQFQHVFLLASSYFFFYYSSNYLITLLIFTTVWDFYLGNQIFSASTIKRKKIFLIMSLCGNLSLLGFFKYADFAVTQFNILGNHFNLQTQIPLLNLALPIGISFYTFHSIGYIVDIYRGQISPSKSLKEYAIFVAFFPQLVAGPILRAGQFLPQLREKIDDLNFGTKLKLIIIENQNLKSGITLMMIGFFKKMFIADNISPMVNDIFSNPMGLDSFTIILGAISFGIQIYCDFSGYSDIAIGTAQVLGFKIPINFNKPYFASTPSNFWKRWHISLSSWLRDYLYIPLGGNKKSSLRTYLNLIIVMFLGGLWHGASWNFVIWGLLHGSYLAIHRGIFTIFPNVANNKIFTSRIGKIISIFITQYLVFFAWIAFRVKDTNNMLYSMSKYVLLDFHIRNTLNFVFSHKFPIAVIIVFIILYLISYRKEDFAGKVSNFKLRYWVPFLVGMMMIVMLFFDGNPEKFIYFQF